jgi:ATP-dependent protease ClpP protease subunit
MGAGYSIKAKGNRSGEILIYEDVGAGWFGGVTAKQFKVDLHALGTLDTLDVRIASYGGDVLEGLAIYRTLAEHKARVITYADSAVASIASAIFMAGSERVIAEAGSVMIHDAWTITAGNAADMRKMADQLESTSGQLAEIYAARTGNSLDQVKAWMAETKWFYGQEAVDAKFADSVAANVRMAAYDTSMWASLMQGRIATRVHLDRHAQPQGAGAPAPQPNPANADVRAQLAKLNERMRARHVTPPPNNQSRGAGA